MRIKTAFIFLLILSLLFLAGCWDYNDYSDLTLVSALGVDLDDTSNEITVTVQYYIPGGGGGNTQEKKSGAKNLPSSGALKAKGVTIADALSTIQQARRKKLFYEYMNVFVVGETAAKNIMADVLGFCDRTPNVRMTSYMTITGVKAEDVLTTMDPNTSVTIGRNIYDTIDQSNHAGSAFPVTIEDFAEKLTISGIEPVAPQVTVKVDSSQNDSSSESTEDNEPVKISTLKEGYQIINGIAAFQGDKLIGWLNVKESTGLGWITNKNMTPYENVSTSSDNDTKSTLVFSVVKSKSKIAVTLDNGNPVFTVNTYMEADLLKYADNTDFASLTPDAVDLMEKQLGENVQSEIKAAIEKGQKDLKTDIFGFGFALYRDNPSIWNSQYENEWQDLFPDIQINVNVNAKVINTGTSIKKFNVN